eukprot:7631457-Pyramimonas_sp.AAC.1
MRPPGRSPSRLGRGCRALQATPQTRAPARPASTCSRPLRPPRTSPSRQLSARASPCRAQLLPQNLAPHHTASHSSAP